MFACVTLLARGWSEGGVRGFRSEDGSDHLAALGCCSEGGGGGMHMSCQKITLDSSNIWSVDISKNSSKIPSWKWIELCKKDDGG